MRTKYMAGVAAALGLLVAGTALAFHYNGTPTDGTAPEAAVVETDNCCLTGDCCCPLQGLCCDPDAKAKATPGVKYVKKAGAGCCVTGNCCCPGQGSCCGEAKATEAFTCPITGEELHCPNCCPLNKAK